ncbi:MAG: serine protease [Ilumatobacteraceae bacterium]|nr:serine protease [Ilumatobacteraceae bacterium]
MERGEWEDDPEYPHAPLPAHERTWRHPSEQGATHWVQSEPPLVVGRGLSVATGTVGVVLAVGLLWLMIPHDNKGGGVSVESSTSVRTAATETITSRQPTTLLASSPVDRSSAPVTTEAAITTAIVTTAPTPSTIRPTTAPAPSTSTAGSTSGSANAGSSAPTDPVTTPTAPASTDDSTPPPVVETAAGSALAVALTDSHYVAATAAAVGNQSSMQVQLPSGDMVLGSVVSVDSTSGIAVLSVPVDVQISPIAPSQRALPTDSAVVMAPQPTPVSVWRGSTGELLSSDPSVPVPEGSLVLDTDNRLIGMCTSGADGIHVLDAAALLDAINRAIASQKPVWLGLHIGVADNGDLTVVEVSSGGPAEGAGIVAGSVVRAIDGQAVQGTDGLDALHASVMAHHPGDTVTLSVVAPGATDPTDVAVTLVANPGSF